MNKPSLVARNGGVLVLSVRFLLLFASTIMLMAGCVSHRSVMSQDARHKLIPFVKDGNTTRDEIKQRLGEPSKVFKQGKVWIYFLKLKEAENTNQDKLVVCDERTPTCPDYHLVLSFAGTDVVQKHSLIRVR